MPVIYINGSTDKRIIDALSQEGEVVLLSPMNGLPSGLSSHADMLIAASDEKAFCYAGYLLRGDFIRVHDIPYEKYPRDVYLNCTFIGDSLIVNPDTVSKAVIEYAETQGFRVIPVKQGYAGCAVCKVSESALITADIGISRAAGGAFDVLTIEAGGISLSGYDVGFIGGASATVNDKVFFFGDLSRHRDGKRIKAFIESHGKKCISFSDFPLTDFGGARVVY